MIRDRSTAGHYRWQQVCDGWRHCDTDSLSVIEERMPPGASETPHHHDHSAQVFFLLGGALDITLGADRHRLAPMQSLHVSPGQIHAVHAPGPQEAVFLVISSPTTRNDRTEHPAT